MSEARVAAFSVSLDGFEAGPRQDINNPLGVRGFELLTWFQGTEHAGFCAHALRATAASPHISHILR